MKDTIVIALPHFADEAKKIATEIDGIFQEYQKEVFTQAFREYKRIIAVMSTGIVVRSIAPLIKDKWKDPAVVVVSPDLKFAVPLLGGHHGANDLVKELEKLNIIPVITTATETTGKQAVEVVAKQTDCKVLNTSSTIKVNAAVLEDKCNIYSVKGPAMVLAGNDVSVLLKSGIYSLGLGCKKGVTGREVSDAINSAIKDSGIKEDEIFVYATTTHKINEEGLKEGVRTHKGNLIFVEDKLLCMQDIHSPSQAYRIGLPGVAEPAALAVSKQKKLVMEKKAYGNVTVAVAK